MNVEKFLEVADRSKPFSELGLKICDFIEYLFKDFNDNAKARISKLKSMFEEIFKTDPSDEEIIEQVNLLDPCLYQMYRKLKQAFSTTFATRELLEKFIADYNTMV